MVLSRGIGFADPISQSQILKIVSTKIKLTFTVNSGNASVPPDYTEAQKKELTDSLTKEAKVPTVGVKQLEHDTVPQSHVIKNFTLIKYSSTGSLVNGVGVRTYEMEFTITWGQP